MRRGVSAFRVFMSPAVSDGFDKGNPEFGMSGVAVMFGLLAGTLTVGISAGETSYEDR